MASISELLIEQGRLLADQRRRRGERAGALVTTLGQIPATIIAGRQQQQQQQALMARQAAQDAQLVARGKREDAQLAMEQQKLAQQEKQYERLDNEQKKAMAAEGAKMVAAMGYQPQHVAKWIDTATQSGLWNAEDGNAAKQAAATPDGAKKLIDIVAGIATQRPQEPYTLNYGDQRRGPNNEVLADNPRVETPTVRQEPNPTEASLAAMAARGDQNAINALKILKDQQPPRAAAQTGRRPMTETAESQLIARLSREWGAAVKPVVELDRQGKIMEASLNAARRGDIAQGAEALLVTFQKILDPDSVVRETEARRSVGMQSLLNRAKGALQRIVEGGSGLPLAEQEKYAALAKELIVAQTKGYVEATKKRLGSVADRYEIPHELIFENYEFGSPTAPAAPAGGNVRMRAPDGRELSVPPGDVARMRAAGAVDF